MAPRSAGITHKVKGRLTTANATATNCAGRKKYSYVRVRLRVCRLPSLSCLYPTDFYGSVLPPQLLPLARAYPALTPDISRRIYAKRILSRTCCLGLNPKIPSWGWVDTVAQ